MRSLGRTVSLLGLLLLISCGPVASTPSSPPTTLPPATPIPPTSVEATITIDSPVAGATVSSPVTVRGSVAVSPFESTLRGRVYDAAGQVVGEGAIMVQAEMDQPGPFEGQIAFNATRSGAGRIEVASISPQDGSVLMSASVEVTLAGPPIPGGTIEIPAPGARATLPLHILARVGRPGQQVVASLRWQDGSELSRTYTLLAGEDGRGLLAESLWWQADVPPLPFPPTQPAVLQIREPDGTVLAQQGLIVVSWDDPATTRLQVFFLLGEELISTTVIVPQTAQVGTAALQELLWGPPAHNLAGFGTALPLPPEVLSYPGRGPDWGPRVRLLGLTIENGVATANFSRELRAYGGGSTRVLLIREQITRTLLQFPTVREVVIAIEGQTEGVLEP